MKSSADLFKKGIAKSAGSEKLNADTLTDLTILSGDMKEDEIPGGLADNMSLSDIAKIHTEKDSNTKEFKKIYTTIKRQLKKGIKTELEHTKSVKVAKEIAKDHLAEDPKYYDKKKEETKESDISFNKSAKTQFKKDLQNDPDYREFKKNAKFMDKNIERTFGVPNVDDDSYISKKKYSRVGKEENKEATGSGSVGGYEAPLFGEAEKIEATEATGSGSVGQYSTTDIWAKSTKKKDWRGKQKTQLPGGEFVSIKKKCQTFPYCNQGDIKALNIYENKIVKETITRVSQKLNLSENVIKAIIQYELERQNKLK